MDSVLDLITRKPSDMSAVAGNRPRSPRAVDPDALGKIRNIVKSAHKWGGDGRKPKFRKIRRVLTSKHPEVIAKAFGGNADVAAAWIKNNWYRMRGMSPPPTRGKGALKAELSLEMPSWYSEIDPDDSIEMPDGSMELFCTIEEDLEESDGLLWTPVMRTGTWAQSPIRGQKGPWTCTRADFDDFVEAFEEKAWEFVTLPMSKAGGSNHIDDAVYDNTGFAEALMVRPDAKRPGHHVLWAGLKFTEPDALALVRNGTVRGVSVNAKFNISHQETGKKYSKVITHICLTNCPFINGLGAFEEKLAASRTEQEVEEAASELSFSSYELEDAPYDVGDLISLARGDVAYEEQLDHERIISALRDELGVYVASEDYSTIEDRPERKPGEYAYSETYDNRGLYVKGITPDTALICAYGRADEGWVVGYDVNGKGDVTIDQPDEWTRVEEAWVELSRFYAEVEEPEDEEDEEEPPVAAERTGSNGEPVVLILDTPKGGASMAKDKDTETDVDQPKAEESMSLTRGDLQAMMADAIKADREARAEEEKAEKDQLRAELDTVRSSHHGLEVERLVASLNEAKKPSAFVKKAQELLLADEKGAEVLSLSRVEKEGDEAKEVKLSVTEIVRELAETVPADLTATTVKVHENGKPVGGQKTPEERAAELMAEIHAEGAVVIDSEAPIE